MKKHYDISQCYYCGRPAESRDHVPPKCLLEKPYPENLLTIPACASCNNNFSLDEEYFLNVLVEVGTHYKLEEKKTGSVNRARERKPFLYERIKRSFVTGDNGRIYIAPEHYRIKKLFEKIALGLYYSKYGQTSSLEKYNCSAFYTFNIEEQRPADVFMLTYSERFVPKKWTCIQAGVFSFIVVKNWKTGKLLMIINIYNTLWVCIDLPQPEAKGRRPPSLKHQLNLFNSSNQHVK